MLALWHKLLDSPIFLIATVNLSWGALSGLYLTLFDSRLPQTDQEWAEHFRASPREAALNSFVKTFGWNLPGAFRALRAFFGGPLPRPVQVILERERGQQALVDAGKELGAEVVSIAERGAKSPILPPPAA